jgi:hypothetical protein
MPAFILLFSFVVWTVVLVVPVVRILRRLGLNEWLAVIVLIPILNLAGLWALAFSEWPAMRPPSPRELDQWSDSDNQLFKKLLDEQRP